MTRWTTLLTAVALTAVLGSGCTEQRDEWRQTHDLMAELPAAEWTAELASLELGTPESRRYLVSGWTTNETERGSQRPFVWGKGSESVLEFPIFRPRDLELSFECRPFTFPGAPAQTVTVELNGQEVGRRRLAHRLAERRIGLPRELLRLGENRLRFRYAYSRSPRQATGVRDRRELAVAWYGLRFEPASAVPQTRLDPEAARLFIPWGAQVDFYLELAPASELLAEEWRFRGAGQGRLQVLLREEGGDEELVAELGEAPRNGRVALPGDATRVARLRLRALPRDDPPDEAMRPDAGIVLTRPRLGSAAPFSRATVASRSPGEAPIAAPPPTGRPNVIVYLIDALRADHLGCYGYPKAVSPAIDAFARQAVLFENAISQSSWTRSSVASIFTGLWPLTHGTNRRNQVLSDAALTLPEILRDHGYRTAAFIGNPNVSGAFGFKQGFDDYKCWIGDPVDGMEVTEAALAWLDEHAGEGRPFFLYLHTIDPHSPYDPPAAYRERFAPEVSEPGRYQPRRLRNRARSGRGELTDDLLAGMLGLYDAEIAFNDDAFGALRDGLEARGLFEEAVILLLSDHGEEFHDHGRLEHGQTLFDESLRVPMILKLGAAGPALRLKQPVQHVDVLPTLLDALGLPPPAAMEGDSLLGRIARAGGSAPAGPRRVFSYLHLEGAARVSLIDGDWKLIQHRAGDHLIHPQLFDLSHDPLERTNLAGQRPLRTRYLTAAMRHRLLAEGPRLESEETLIDGNLRRVLEALGYLN